jgi:surface carbohydrate biosynthesis protein (TIGR04326 family)
VTVSLLVWDRTGVPSGSDGEVLYWRSCVAAGGTSVPLYLEKNAERLRADYLAFIHDLGESRIGGKRIVEHLALEDGFSFWWMTQLAEKSPFKSPRIYTCLRLLALEEILRERKPSRLALASADRDLAKAVSALCRDLEIGFEWRIAEGGEGARSLRGAYRMLPYPLRGLIGFARYLLERWPLRRFERPRWFSGDEAVFFCSFFAHLDAASCARGDFRSRQWGTLPQSLRAAGRRSDWVHHFLLGPDVPDARTAMDWLSRFNANADAQGAHAFLDCYWTWGVVARAFKRWLWLNAVARRLGDVSSAAGLRGSAAWLWPLLRDDWLTSLTGPVAVSNCLWLELFDAALRDIPPQKKGLYLCENQGWERAMLRAWRANGHGEIIGVAHSTVPFWHLYYFDDPRSLDSRRTCAMPQPDRFALNGRAAWTLVTDAGYPVERLVEVEALRYLDVPRAGPRPAPDPERMKVLILGDVIPASMHSLLTSLEKSIASLPPDWSFTFKPHPIHAVDLGGYPGLARVRTTSEALDRIVGGFDVAVSANSTSASVDAYLAGLPVVIGLDGIELNLSPLRGQPGVSFAVGPEDFAAALRAAARASGPGLDRDGFFFLDPGLPRWKRLLL